MVKAHTHMYILGSSFCQICGSGKPGEDEVTTDPMSRQRAVEALVDGFDLEEHGPSCNCDQCQYLAECMVDAVIEAWSDR